MTHPTIDTPAHHGEHGQATVEYALVLLAAAALAIALITWITGTDTIAGFFEAVLRRVRAYV